MEVDDLEMGDGYTVKWAKEFLSRKHEKPFFLAVGLFQPHLPFYAPQKYFDALPQEQVELPINKEGDLDDIPEGGLRLAANRRQDLRMIEGIRRPSTHGAVVFGEYCSRRHTVRYLNGSL